MRTLAHHPLLPPRVVPAVLVAFAVGLLGALTAATPGQRAEAATVTAAYTAGHREVRLNGYGAAGLGTFTLRFDAGDPHTGERLALCIEAHTSHSTVAGAYRLVPNRVHSPQLDYLLWKYGAPGTAEHVAIGEDHDTATALAALAWFYAGAQRRGGGAVWADPTDGGSPVTPVTPHPWSALPSSSGSSPIGLRAAGIHLAASERRVHELYLEAEARRGPWTMSPIERHDSRASVTVRGPAGPITGVGGVRFVVRDHRGVVTVNRVVTTDATGIATVDLDDLVDGGTIEASMFAPGVHQEWDGDGDVQRLSTATNVRLERRLDIDPVPRYVEVVKRSSDPAFSPSGGRFALLDGRGRTVSTVTTDEGGGARFDPIDLRAHPGPHRVRELDAPDGLVALDRDVTVDEPLSTDRARPTTVEVTNDPERFDLRVRKVLDDDRLGPADRSGFGFEVIRSDGRSFGTVTTRADGRTPRLAVTRGRFDVCERSLPPWAEVLTDGGCVTVEIGPGAPAVTDVQYANLAPTPTLSTRVRVDGTGHQRLSRDGGALVDVVSHTGLVPGTRYRLHGEILAITPDGAVPTGLRARLDVEPERADGHVEMTLEIPDPAASGLDVGVVVQRMYLADELDADLDEDPRVDPVAVHDDPGTRSQTFWVPALDTAARLDDDGLVDQARYRGMPPGNYTATVVWFERHPDGTCRETGLTATAFFEVHDLADHQGTVDIGPVDIGPDTPIGDEYAGRTLVAFQTIDLETDDGPERVVEHTDCDADEQTVTLDPIRDEAIRDETIEPPPSAPEAAAPTSTTSTTSTTTAPPTTPPTPRDDPVPTVSSPGPPATLPATGSGGLQSHAGLALMALGAGGLVLVTAAHGRRRPVR